MNNLTCGETCAPVPQSINRYLKEVEESVLVLGAALSQLVERLDPVLLPEAQATATPSGDKPIPENRSQIGHYICGIRDQISAITSEALDLSYRVEL